MTIIFIKGKGNTLSPLTSRSFVKVVDITHRHHTVVIIIIIDVAGCISITWCGRKSSCGPGFV